MRSGHKSKTKRFEGHKAAVAVDTESQLITAVDVLAGNAQDYEQALELVKASEANLGLEVEETIGDCAYGEGKTRQAFADAKRTLIAKVPPRPNGRFFSKEDFSIDPRAKTCVCPAGQTSRTLVRLSAKGRPAEEQRFGFRFDCAECPLRPSCVRAKSGGRTVSLHPQEALLQAAKAFQRSQAFAPYRKLRQVAEHRLARLVQLGIRQARYFGRAKTKGQLLLTSTVANLTLVARALGLIGPARRAVAL
jgi:transposase